MKIENESLRHLPMIFRLIAATILADQNRHLLAEITYLRAEVDYYRSIVPTGRRKFTVEWRKRLSSAGAALGWSALAKVATVAKASTLRQWHSLMKAGRLIRKRMGRPRTKAKIEKLVLRMAEENQWGQIRISGELQKLGVTVCPRTVAAILKRNGLPSGPHRLRTALWKPFIAEHDHEIVGTDFFTADVWTWLGRKTIYVLFAVHLGTRRAHVMGISDHPNEAFMKQVARESVWEGGWMHQVGAKRIIYDRDTKFCRSWADILDSGGIKRLPLPVNSPNLNAFAERWVRTVKRECLNRVHLIGRAALKRALDQYVEHYNRERPHQGLKNDIPEPSQKVENNAEILTVRCRKRLGGVLKHYYRGAA